MKELEKILKALANKRRLVIIKYLKEEKEAVVGDVARFIRLSFKSTSKHLSILRVVDIIEREQRGPLVFYSLNPNKHTLVDRLLSLL